MFQFFKIVASANLLAVEFARNPYTITSAELMDTKKTYHEESAFEVRPTHSVAPVKKLSLSSIFDLHLFFEKEFILQEYDFVKTRENKFYIDNIHSEVDQSSLVSLFYDSIITNTALIKRNKLHVSCRDYFDKDQNQVLYNSFKDLGFSPIVIPESLAAIVTQMLTREVGKTYNDLVINFRGSHCTLNSFTTDLSDKAIKIENVKVELLSLISDHKVEKIIFDTLKDILSQRETGKIRYLPYEKSSGDFQYFCDIRKAISEIALVLDLSENHNYTITEIAYYSIEDIPKKSFFIEVVVNLDDIRNKIKKSSQEGIDLIKAKIEQDYKDFMIHNVTDIAFLSSIFGTGDLIRQDYIVKGLHHAFNGNFHLVDPRIIRDSGDNYIISKYASIASEFNTFVKGEELGKDVLSRIESFEAISPEEKNEFVEKYSLTGINPIASMDYNTIQEFLKNYNLLYKKNLNTISERNIRKNSIINLENVLNDAKDLIGKLENHKETPNVQSLISSYNDIFKFFEENKDDYSIAGGAFDRKVISLSIYLKVCSKILEPVEKPKEEIPAETDADKYYETIMNNMFKNMPNDEKTETLKKTMYERFKDLTKKFGKMPENGENLNFEEMAKEVIEKEKDEPVPMEKNNKKKERKSRSKRRRDESFRSENVEKSLNQKEMEELEKSSFENIQEEAEVGLDANKEQTEFIREKNETRHALEISDEEILTDNEAKAGSERKNAKSEIL